MELGLIQHLVDADAVESVGLLVHAVYYYSTFYIQSVLFMESGLWDVFDSSSIYVINTNIKENDARFSVYPHWGQARKHNNTRGSLVTELF